MDPNRDNSRLNAAGTLGFFIGTPPEIAPDGKVMISALHKTPTGWDSPSAFIGPARWPETIAEPEYAGSFAAFISAKLNIVNDHIHDIVGGAKPAPIALAETPTPATWADAVAFTLANFHVTDTGYVVLGSESSAPVAPGTPAWDGIDWRTRFFDGGVAFETGRDLKTGEILLRKNVGNGIWKTARFD